MCTHIVPTSDHCEASKHLPPLPKATNPSSVQVGSKYFTKMNLSTLKE